ncbi:MULTISPECIES: radical SAM protein [unclassified Methanoculleus]|uniref:radical SAM protein n=1 Tax=unclassified Methanoculleus TaxID=2619537 RepID=UPI0025D749EF|nr:MULTISPECIES: radical SAM protein [unclassified Methanoculleus]MCK9318675.1 helix-hairpin-helix domain-containing protein [Methanoculleus sp.]MDD2254544.1 helix-hairpin-helix domain-containing protein [Methanoculleus sp.]MDD2787107.1 helix-hairpin-helix domain-containing protein [Methanoculleus sp.]MDD3215980.1 helix-hairpin-helix domain-containing protein [Methanoculleus sp.]MDD4314098.1 helix-hairpin-helix domain-containing protein [Methanoculleus sp.]
MSVAEQKLTYLTAAGRFDLCCPGECIRPLSAAHYVTYNRRAGGCGRMLKMLLNGTCAYDCGYCPVRLQREQVSFSPGEFADTFLRLWRDGLVEGLFLSSGIPRDVDLVMHDLVETGEILRRRGYDGYLHLKVLPGATRADIHDAARVADRISINLETTSPDRLGGIAGVKDYRQDILKRQAWVAEEKPGRHTTQLVIGAADETDAEVLACLADQYRRVRPSRVYFSAFRAMQGTPLASHPDTPAWRARRWYQADYLLRDYGVAADDLRVVLDEDGLFPNRDPKEVLAASQGPVNVNLASRRALLRVPGIGPKGADRILSCRKERPFSGPPDLVRAGIRGHAAGRHLTFGERGTVQTQLLLSSADSPGRGEGYRTFPNSVPTSAADR